MATQDYPITERRLKIITTVPSIGALFLIQLAGVYVMDWWFHFQLDDTSVRFWPHLIRAAFVLQLIGYSAFHLKRTWKLRIARFQFLWLGILALRFLFHGNFESEVVLYMSYYAYWVLVMWVAYSLVVDGHLTPKQVAIAGMLANLLQVLRDALWGLGGIWLGNPLGPGLNPADVVANSAYPIFWFTLMQLLDTDVPLTGPIALLGLTTIVLTMKRGTLIALILGALAYGITYARIHRYSGGIRRVAKISAIVVVAIGVTAWLRAGAIAERWGDISNPDQAGSGRAVFWAIIAQHWLNADLITKFVGFGPHSVYDITAELWFAGVPAHDDWLMLIHEFGIIGLIAFAMVCWAMAKSVPRIIRGCPQLAPVFCAALAGALCVTIFDLFAYNTETSFFGVLIAIPLGMATRASPTEVE